MKYLKLNNPGRILLLLLLALPLCPAIACADTPFLGEIRWVAFNYAPKNWALCNGQLLPINQNQALFALLGTTFGGNGQTTFALPNLQGRAPIHEGNGHIWGERSGEEAHTLTMSEMPAHTHTVLADPREGNVSSPVAATPAKTAAGTPAYSGQAPNTSMKPDSLSNTGGSQSHGNMKPYLSMTCIIAITGIFPSSN